MTFHSHICFSLLALQLAPSLLASVSGIVELSGRRNAPRKRKDCSGVVVWLEPADPRAARPAAPVYKRVEMVQKDKKFSPHILAIPVGTQVDFPNFDPIFHNAFSSFSGQPFDVGLYPPSTSRSVTFKRDGVVRVFCNIHQTMSAVIVVLKTPWYGITNAQGNYQIAGVPPGEYRLHVFYERTSSDVLKGLERKVVVDASAALPPIVIPESDLPQPPHKNKFGQDYPPIADENVYYPGVKK